jgi:glycosyltransferase involved in cell wall biosynthesis
MSEKVDCFFSLIIATFNVKKQLPACINSLQNQSFNDYEVLISDGGSVDGTLEFIETSNIRNLTWYKSTADNGIYDALNKAIDQASGKWVLVLGSDDLLADCDSLKHAHQQIVSSGIKEGLIYSNIFIARQNDVVLKVYPEIIEFNRRYGGGAFFHHQSAFISLGSLLNANKFSNEYFVHADYDLMLKVFKNEGAKKIKGAYVIYNANGFSSKLANIFRSFTEIYRIRRNHCYPPIVFRILITYLAMLLRKLLGLFR